MFDYTDFSIIGPDDPTFTQGQIIEEDIINIIIQKYKTILFTNQGDVMGDPNFGGDLELLLYQTKVSDTFVKNQLITQIGLYIPELINTNYTLDVAFTQDVVNYYDIMYVYFKIADFEVYAQFGKSIT